MTFSTFASPGVGLQGGGGSGGGGTASLPISGNGATITTSTPLINGTQTWNSGATTFTSLLLNVTDTASAAASLLMDLQVGGTSRFSVGKTGGLTFAGNLQVANNGVYIEGTVAGSVRVPGVNGYFGFTTNTSSASGSTIDLFLTRRAAANLRLGAADAAAPVAQTLSVQSVVAGTSNTAGANLTITGSQGTGTGAGGSIIFQVAPAGSSGTAQNALATALTIDSTRLLTTAGNLQVANNAVYIEGTAVGTVRVPGVGGYFGFTTNTASTSASTIDVLLYRDAANTLALRNGTNAQTFNVYNTFTSSTNFERFRIFAQSAAAVLIGTEKGSGGGTARALALQTDGTTRLTIETNGDLTIADAENIILGTTTGTKIGTATTQKIGFFNAAPVVQPTAVADATDAATVITQLNALLSRMRDLGLIAT